MEIKYADFSRMHEPLREQFDSAYRAVYNSQWFIKGKKVEEFADFCGA